MDKIILEKLPQEALEDGFTIDLIRLFCLLEVAHTSFRPYVRLCNEPDPDKYSNENIEVLGLSGEAPARLKESENKHSNLLQTDNFDPKSVKKVLKETSETGKPDVFYEKFKNSCCSYYYPIAVEGIGNWIICPHINKKFEECSYQECSETSKKCPNLEYGADMLSKVYKAFENVVSRCLVDKFPQMKLEQKNGNTF
jgi:hypothetical protein